MQTDNPAYKTVSLLLIIFIISAIFMIIFRETTIQPAARAMGGDIYYADDEYQDNGESTLSVEEFSYASKVTSQAAMVNNTFPAYYNTNNALTNACANVAGANLIGFFDRYYEELIPNCTPGMPRGNNYSYYSVEMDLEERQGVIDDLYVRMGTNNPTPGTSQTGYKTGLASYASSKGRTATFASVMTGSSLDISKLHQAISSGKPVSLYLSGYNISQVYDYNNEVTIAKSIYTGNHIMIVYGYKIIKYYNSSNALIKSKTYLYVSTGVLQTGYYVLNNNGTINDAESVNIS